MSNLVLYRKYRPQTFKDFVGQKHVVKIISNEIEANSVSHAYLFSGHRGTGKTTLARLFAKAINCQNRKGFEPCNKCVSCLEINKGNAVDLIEIDAASNRGIDDIRSLREGVRYRPNLLKYKVIILDEAHQLSKDAANALLKILEEPPEYVIFILATTEAHKMIPTIASRCQRFDFYKLTIEEIVNKLADVCKKENIKIEKGGLELIAGSSEGSMRDAEGILNQVLNFTSDKEITIEELNDILGLVDLNLVIEFSEYVAKKDIASAIKFVNENIEKGLSVEEFSKSLINYLRKILILKINSDLIKSVIPGETEETRKKILEQAKGFEEKNLQRLLNLLLEAEGKRRYSTIPQLPLELALVEYKEG